MKPTDSEVLERNVSTLLESGGEVPKIGDAARARIRAQLVDKFGQAVPKRALSPVWAVGIGLAATGAAALVVTNLVGGGETIAPTTEVAGGKLSDGTSWLVDTGGKVTVVGDRRVRVEGAALLDVAPGKRPFVVETARGQIEVLGTRFLVNADAAKTTTAVVRGQVKLTTTDGQVVLHAGEQGIAEPGKPPTRGPAPRLSHLVSWAQQARARDEGATVQPLRNGTLFARDPNNPRIPEAPLPIAKLTVDVVVEDQVARVALDQTFHNAAPLTMEGMYRFAIPPDASLQRLAMYVDGTLNESAVVERMRARRIYEEIVYRRLDPALLEWAGTGRLSLRVYPLPPREDKRLLLAYTQSLPKLYDDWTVRVPLPEVDLPVGELAFDVRVKNCGNCELSTPGRQIQVRREGEDAIVTYREKSAKLGDSLVLHVRDKRAQATVATFQDGGDEFVMVRAKPDLARTAKPYRPRTWIILDDVSASRGPMELRAQADVVDSFLKELDEDDRVAVLAFDVAARQKLPPTRVMDVDRKAVYAALRDEGGVGATNFEAALAAATKLLGQVAPEDAMVVYIGDGVITTGPRNLDAIAKQLVGKAQFIGVGIGDGPDTQTLHALAAATGGYATTIDLADDLAWESFDLVAALHTPRVTGLSAKLVDAAGAHVPSTLYVKTPQLADGEELELVGKLASTTKPVAAIVSGTLDGKPWQQRIDLGAARSGGYLPRLWAQRHIDARMLAKHEAVVAPVCAPVAVIQSEPPPVGRRGAPPPPAPVVCPTEAELRAKRDEDIRQEIVALGKKYFLLSRHTSLIVLENDKMYEQYGVTKGAGDTWSPYQVPAKIPVVKSTAPLPDVADDAELVRSPLRLFHDYGTYGFETGELANLRGHRWDRDRFVTTRNKMQENPLAAAHAVPATVPAAEKTAAKAPSAPRTTSPADSMTLSLEEGKMGKGAREPEDEQQFQAELRQRVSSNELLDGDDPWGGDVVGGTLGNGSGAGFGVAGGRSSRRTVDKSGGYYQNMQWISPLRLMYPTDAAFDDVTAFMPALVADDADGWRAELEASGTNKPQPIDDAAKQLLAKARAATPTGVYRWGDFEIAIDSARRFGWRRTTDVDLTETASFDGSTFTRRYAELGVDVTRTVTDDDVALSLAYFPLWIAEAAHYARWFEVSSAGPRKVSLARAPIVKGGKPEVAYVLEFDDKSRLVAIYDGQNAPIAKIAWNAAGPVAATIGDATVQVGFTAQAIGDATTWAHGQTNPGIAIELPGRMPKHFEAKLAKLTAGSPEWRHVQRQYMASLAATSDRNKLWLAYEALGKHGGIEYGDIALASGGIAVYATEAQLAQLVATYKDQPLARYLAASRAYSKQPAQARMKGDPAPGLVGSLWTLRDATALLANYDSGAQGKLAVDKLVAIPAKAFTLRLVGAGLVASRWQVKPEDAARAFEAVAVGPYRNVARAQVAMMFANRGRYDAAAERAAALVADLDLAAQPVNLQQMQYHFQSSRRGQAGWQLVWATWRDKVLASTSYEHVMALLAGASSQPVDVPRILARAIELAGSDPNRVVAVARLAVNHGHGAWALTKIEPLVKTQPTRELHQLVAQILLSQGRTADALSNLEAAQALGGDEAVGLSTIRSEFSQLINLARQVAVQSSGTARDAAVRKAMTFARQWRSIDPGNAQIDSQLGDLLLVVGNTDEAWRQLSGVIERDPMSGDGYITVADTFERQGRVAEAVELWHQAMVIDQTNPMPRMRKAQALIALGKAAEGDALLADILARKWHDRHMGVIYQVQNLVERGKQVK